MNRTEKALGWAAATLFVVVVISSLAFAFCGCAGYKSPTYSTLAAVVDAAGAAREMLPAACEKAEMAAVAKAKTIDEARAGALAIQQRCDAAVVDIEAVVKVAKTARDGIHDVSAAAVAPSNLLAWAVSAVDAYKNLTSLLATLGVSAPKIPGIN